MRTRVSFFQIYVAVLVLCLCFVENTIAQQVIEGCVFDDETGAPLSFVSVRNEDGDIGCVSDDSGCFALKVDSLPIVLQFQLLGFKTEFREVKSVERIIVRMKSSTIMLNELNINAKKDHRFAGNTKHCVWDYGWLNGHLLICEFQNTLSKSRLVLLTTTGDTLSYRKTPDKPLGIFNDCTGAVYFVSADSLWQCFFEKDHIEFGVAESPELIDRVLKYCVGQNDESIYFAIPSGKEIRIGADVFAYNYESNNDRMNYYIFDRNTEKMDLFKTVSDEFTLALKKDEQEYGNGPQPKRFTGSAFSNAASKLFFYTIMCKEIDAPMYLVDNTLFIFNSNDNYIEKCDLNGVSQSKCSMEFHRQKNYQRMTIMDEEHHNIFALFEEDGYLSLHRINLSNGSLMDSISIPNIFPEHITIRDGYIYYLCRDQMVKEARVLNRIKLY